MIDQVAIDEAKRYFANKIANLPVQSLGVDREWLGIINLLTDPEWHLSRECRPIDRVRFRYREYAMAELIRLKWDGKFRAVKVPKAHRQLCKLEASLWLKVLNLTQEVFLLNRSGYLHPAEWFGCILIESCLVGPFATDLGKDQFLKQLRSENKQLLTLHNPFESSSSCPHTQKLIDQATTFAGQLDQFRVGTYTPMVKARQALTTHLATEAKTIEPKSLGFIVGRQGRKPSLSTN